METKKYRTKEGNLIVVRKYPHYDLVEFSTREDRDHFLNSNKGAKALTIKVHPDKTETYPVKVSK